MLALATDFDGTIYFLKDKPSFHQEDLDAISRFQENNLLGLCSGRPIHSIEYFTKGYFTFDFMIASTGSYIVDHKGNVLLDCPMKMEDVLKISHLYIDSHVMFFHCDQFFTTYKKDLMEDTFSHKTIQSLDDLYQYKTYQMTIVCDDIDQANEICEHLNKNYEVNAFCNGNLIDIVHKGCSKGKGIQICKEYYKLEKIAGIGDGENDIPMFKAVDESYTFSYSRLNVQQQADYVVDHFYQAVNQLLEKE